MSRRVKLTYPQELIREPLLFSVAKRFEIMPNIRRARVTETVGELVLELDGAEENLDKALKYLQDKGVEIENMEGDFLE